MTLVTSEPARLDTPLVRFQDRRSEIEAKYSLMRQQALLRCARQVEAAEDLLARTLAHQLSAERKDLAEARLQLTDELLGGVEWTPGHEPA